MIYLVTKQSFLTESKIYKIITVEESLTLLQKLENVGFDTETQGLDPWTKKLLLVQLGCKEFQVVIDCTTIDILLYKEFLEDTSRLLIGWNLKFDMKFMLRAGIFIGRVFDGFLAEKLLYLGYPSGMHRNSLKDAGYEYLHIELDKSVRGKIINAKVLTDDIVEYSANDVKYLEDIMNLQIAKLKEKGLMKAVEVENNFIFPLTYCEYCGVKLDVERWKKKMAKDNKELEESETALNQWVINWDKAGKYTAINMQGDLFGGFDTDPKCTINWNSPKQVMCLFEDLGLNLESRDGKSIDAKVLKPQKDKTPLVEIYLRYKAAAKVVGTYGQNFLDQINSVSGRIHTSYQQLGADTTRITSGGKDRGNGVEYVNLLNLPADAETRACFIAEEGNKWISIDYSGQETYLMASIANDKAIIKELEEGSGDIHSLTAYISYPDIIPRDTPIKEIKTKYHEARQEAKGIEFAINYGGTADTIYRNKGIPKAKAKQIYDNYMSGFTGLRDYQAFRKEDWTNKGYILLNQVTGHKVFIWDYEDLKRSYEKFEEFGWDYYRQINPERVREFTKRRSDLNRMSINYPIQATGSMCLRFSLIYLYNYLKKNNLLFKVKICITPYDEINIEAPKEISKEMADILYKCMVKAGKIFCTRCNLDADLSTEKDGSLPTYWIH
jgi:DNA polymerase I-like protein with 3'-5' exonuclease and polymerase domains